MPGGGLGAGLPKWVLAIAGVLAVGYAAFAILLWRLGLFDVPETGSNAQVFAAVFALLGALFGAILTFAAALLKHSLDTRTFELSRQSEKRRQAENALTEARLRLDTAIRAVDLLATADGSPSPPVKQAGSLFALANLGQIDLALALLSQTWARDEVGTEAALWIIDRGLNDDDDSLQVDSARIYSSNASKIASPEGLDIPATVWTGWPLDLPRAAREYLLDGILNAVASVSPADWDIPTVLGVIDVLNEIWTLDPVESIHEASGLALRTLLQHTDDSEGAILRDGSTLDFATLREDLRSLPKDMETGRYYSETIGLLNATWPPADDFENESTPEAQPVIDESEPSYAQGGSSQDRPASQ